MDGLAGVIVGHADLGESDRIVRLLTADHGRISVVARGARRSKKRFAGMLELGNRVRVRCGPIRGSLRRLDEVDLVEPVRRPREDLLRLTQLTYGCELIGALAGEEVPAPRLARLLVVWLELLEAPQSPGRASRQALEAKALHFAGLLPSLLECDLCGLALEGPVNVALDGGPRHPSCGPGTPCETSALTRLHELLHSPIFDSVASEASAAAWLLSDLAQYGLGKRLQSRVLLSELELPE